jgi:DNA-binding transcriptional ArsR family regulator
MDKPYEETACYFRALAHPARLRILAALRHGEECVCHLETLLGKPQSYVSQQLAILRDACLVQDRKDGQRVYYVITDARVLPLLDDYLQKALGGDMEKLERERLDSCPCPRCTAAGAPSSDQV